MLPKSIQNLIEEFSKLPGIGPKTAARLTFYLLNKAENDVQKLGESVINLKKGLIFCSVCYNISEQNPCSICQDLSRDKHTICVVEEPLDIIAVEKTGFKGTYHVLGGVISPIDGIGPEDLRINQLIDTIKSNQDIKEIILATDPSLEGEATSMYILERIKQSQNEEKIDKKLKITRLARGLPVGGDLEYADEVTLRRALEGRSEII